VVTDIVDGKDSSKTEFVVFAAPVCNALHPYKLGLINSGPGGPETLLFFVEDETQKWVSLFFVEDETQKCFGPPGPKLNSPAIDKAGTQYKQERWTV
jgi:hypothetical protein